MTVWKMSGLALLLLWLPAAAHAQAPDLQAAGQQIVKADADFAKSVADRNRERFLSFVADATTFNGGTPAELHGRDAVMKDWEDFFKADGPTLTWVPIKGEVLGAGDLGYTTDGPCFAARRGRQDRRAPGAVPDRLAQAARRIVESRLRYRIDPAVAGCLPRRCCAISSSYPWRSGRALPRVAPRSRG
jgi:ketosteroid isomerase-like protein